MITRILKRLTRRIFWRHQWVRRDSPYPVRKCSVCGMCQTLATDGGSGTWHTMLKGVPSRHWSAP